MSPAPQIIASALATIAIATILLAILLAAAGRGRDDE